MSNDQKVDDTLPEQPAAALLFQAPQFRAPKPDAPTGSENAEAGEPARGGAEPKRDQSEQQHKSDKAKQKQKPKQKSKRKQTGQKQSGQKQSGQKQTGPQQPGQKKSEKKESGQAKTPQGSGEKDADKRKQTQEPQRSTRRRRRRPRSEQGNERSSRASSKPDSRDSSRDEVQGLKGSTRLEAKRMRRREGRRDSRRRQAVTEAEFLARREDVDRKMVVRHADGADQIAVLEDDILVEHFVARRTTQSIVGNVYLGKVQNVLPSMEAAFIDIGRGRNAVLYAGEVNWVALGMEGKPRRIELAMQPGDNILVQVTKDPIGHKGARLTSQPTLAGRYLVFVPSSNMLGISRKLPEGERKRLKKMLRDIVPSDAGVIVRTAAEGATREQLADDVERLSKQWTRIEEKQKRARKAPVLLRGEPELAVRVVRDQFNEDVRELVVEGKETWETIHDYVEELSPELLDRMQHWTHSEDVFDAMKIRPQLAKAMDRKVWLPSGGTLVIERTEALTVIDVNTGKFVGSGGTLEETVTKNNLEAAEEIVRQLRLRDIGGIIIIDFVDMVLEANRELVMRRLVESLGRDRTRHQVTEITSLGLVQMTRKRVGEGLVDAFSTTCEVCEGRGFIVHDHPVETHGVGSVRAGHGDRPVQVEADPTRGHDSGAGENRKRPPSANGDSHVGEEKVRTALNQIAAATVSAEEAEEKEDTGGRGQRTSGATRKRRAKATRTQPEGKAEAKGRQDRQPPEQSDAQTVKKPMSVDDIELPKKDVSDAPPKRPARRRAVSAGRLDTSSAAPGTIVKVDEHGKSRVLTSVDKKAQRKPQKDDATKAKERESAVEAVRDLLDS